MAFIGLGSAQARNKRQQSFHHKVITLECFIHDQAGSKTGYFCVGLWIFVHWPVRGPDVRGFKPFVL
ncbi:hypothetical protein VN23_14615 [Janthinobacterium sp. B9-8]|nr:hypothetical protein VN23_14615 [Janthinobacterium sp. B9-8]